MKLAASALLLAFFAASPQIRYFRYQRPVQTAPQQSGQTCLAVDPAIFAHAAPQLADLRLYNDTVETPYVVRVATWVEGAQKSVPPLNLGVQGGQTVFDAELSDAHYSDLQLAITAQNFIATVTVSGSNAKSPSPQTKLGAYTVFDLSRQKLGRSTVLHLPQSDFPYLHFRISAPLRPEDITGLSVERQPASQPRYQTVAESSQVTAKGHTSVVEFTVPAHVPVDRIAFAPGTAPAQFSRDVAVSVAPIVPPSITEGEEPPQPINAFGNLLRIHSVQDGKRIDEERLVVDAPATDFATTSKWTVTIENGDDLPLALKTVRLEMLQRTLCFDAAANTSYTLYYGDAALAAPRYDYATLFASQASPAAATAAPEQSNPTWQSRPDERPFTEKHPALLWVALILVIALLGVIALKSQKPATPAP